MELEGYFDFIQEDVIRIEGIALTFAEEYRDRLVFIPL